MSNFNQFFKNQGAKQIVEKFFTGVDMYNPKAKLTELKWHIEDDTKPASYYIENGQSATFKVILEYTVNWDGEIRTSEFEVPKEVDGAFIIEGAYRIATNTLGNDYDCRINMSGTGRYYINFDYDRQYDINKGVLRIKRTNPELGLPERVRDYTLDEIDAVKGLEKEALRLTDRQSKKLQIKLNMSYKPEFITKQLIEECIAFGDDRIKDMIIDKKIESVPAGFMNYLFRGNNNRNFYGTRRKIQNYWQRFGKLQDQVNVLTMLCARYWKGSSDAKSGGSDVQISPGVNAINLQTLTNKIQIPESVAYNASFSDLICVGATPVNQNVGKQNSLTVATTVTDTDVLFNVYDKEKMQMITIPYFDYLNSKVAASEYVDYENRCLKPNEQGQVEVKYRLKRVMVPVEEVELIDMEPDYRLSEEVRRIPFTNYTDSVRICMGSSMLKQAIPLVNAERPLVDTGNKDELKNNILNEKFSKDEGVIKEINEREVVIELPNKETVEVPRRTAIQSVNDIDVYMEPKVKVGQKVKKGDIITGAVGLEEDTYKSGINALVLFHAMFGLVNEDALVVSDSFAKKMCNYSLIDLVMDVKYNEAIKWIAPIGTKVHSKDSIVTTYKAVRLDEVNKLLADKLGGIFGDGKDYTEYTIENQMTVPNNIDEAYVSDVMVQEIKAPRTGKGAKKLDLTFAHTSKEVIDEYMKEMDRKQIYDRFPEYVASDVLDPVNLDDCSNKVVYRIRVRLVKRTNVMIGSKITNRYGGKGVVAKVLSDDKMPVMVDKDGKKKIVDVVMNPYSTINRKIPSVNMETLLGLCIHKIHDLVEKYKTTETGKKKIMPLIQKYYPGKYDGMDVGEFIKLHDTKKIEDVYGICVGSYSFKFTPELIEQWANELGVEPQSQILMPADTVADLGELKNELSEDEYNEAVKGLTGKYVPVDKPLTAGYMTFLQLQHIPMYSNKVTSSMFGSDINEWKDSPIMGRGQYRKTGQTMASKIKELLEQYRTKSAALSIHVFATNDVGFNDHVFIEFLKDMVLLDRGTCRITCKKLVR